MTSHPTEDLSAFALGALDAADASAVRAHVDSCAHCRAELRTFEDTAWALASGAARDTPARLRATIVARAREESRGGRGRASALAALLWRPVPAAIPLALVVAVVVSAAAYVGARRDADTYGAALAQVAGARVVALSASGEIGGVSGSLVVPSDGGAPYLILDLPAAPAGKTWEAWVIRGEAATAAGITDARGVTTLVLRVALAAGDLVALTAEPAGGLDQPSGKPVLAGRT